MSPAASAAVSMMPVVGVVMRVVRMRGGSVLTGGWAEKIGKRVRAEKVPEHLFWIFEHEVESKRRVEVVEKGRRPLTAVMPVPRPRLVTRSRSSCQSLLSELVVNLSLLFCSCPRVRWDRGDQNEKRFQ